MKKEGRELTYTELENITWESSWPYTLSNYIGTDLVVDAMGGWSNMDILSRVLSSMDKFTKEDIIVIGTTEGQRLMLPSINEFHTEQNLHKNSKSKKWSSRAKGYTLVGVPTSLAANEYEKASDENLKRKWQSVVNFQYEFYIPYRSFYETFWIDKNIIPLVKHLQKNFRVVLWKRNFWNKFKTWADEGKEFGNDKHWSLEGQEKFARFIFNCIDKKDYFPNDDSYHKWLVD